MHPLSTTPLWRQTPNQNPAITKTTGFGLQERGSTWIGSGVGINSSLETGSQLLNVCGSFSWSWGGYKWICSKLTSYSRDSVCKLLLRTRTGYSVQTSFEDVLFLSLGIFVCIVGTRGLRVVTCIMVIWMLAEEAVQLKTQKFGYFKSKENILDIGLLTLALPMLYLPYM